MDILDIDLVDEVFKSVASVDKTEPPARPAAPAKRKVKIFDALKAHFNLYPDTLRKDIPQRNDL